jgi:hypothetical protein
MQPRTGYYFVIQYCPDPSRMEAANVGVVLFCAEPFYLKARTAKSNGRIRRFFGSPRTDWARINLIKYSIENRLTVDRDQFRDLASLEHFAATRANDMRLTRARAVAVEDPDAELARLFDRLVGGRTRERARDVREALDKSFSAPDVAPFVRRNLTVRLPVFPRPVRAPFGFQNDRLHLIQPVRFQGLAPDALLARAGKHALQGELLHDFAGPPLGPLELVVVGQFADAQAEIAEIVRGLLAKNHTDLYRLDEIDKLLAVIRTTAKASAHS